MNEKEKKKEEGEIEMGKSPEIRGKKKKIKTFFF